jgi:hypothetical protein
VYGTYLSTDGRAALLVAGFDEERLDYHTIFTRLQALKGSRGGRQTACTSPASRC